MRHSIEDIWQKGFINNNALIAPQVNDLYNQKSKNIVDKCQYMFKLNNRFLIGLAITICVLFATFKIPLLGFFYAFLIAILWFASRSSLKDLALVNKKVSSYQYLTSFNKWLKGSIAKITTLYRFIYPAMFISGMLQLYYSATGQSLILTIFGENSQLWFGLVLEYYLVIIVLLIALVISYFAEKIYLADIKAVYGPTFQKLEEIINEMESLRQ